MDLKTRLLDTPPRDLSGPNASDRFTYQHTWALCHLLQLHILGQDYVVIFDHFEDVTVLDAEIEPSLISGYQIKTKDASNFTVNGLLKRENGEGEPPKLLPSILGKLYDLKVRFPMEVKLLAIVANASVSVRLKSDGAMHRDQILTKFADLHDDEQKKIVEALEAEFPAQTAVTLDGVLEFIKSDIPLDGHQTHARGKLVEFLQHLFPNREFKIVPLFQALLSEVVSRNNNHEQNSDYAELLRRKSLSRRRFTEVLQEAGVSAQQVDRQEVSQRLNAEGCSFALLTAMRQEWDAVQLDRLAKRDVPYLRLRDRIKSAVDLHFGQARLLDLIDVCYGAVVPQLREEWGFSEAYVKICIVLEAYEHP